jgi:5-methyltetrahydropteroyltriglutamate--homocysteine methyltransferase
MLFQEEIDLTVPVGGEFLREDMAAYFGVKLCGRLLDFVPSYENRRYRPVEYSHPIRYSGRISVEDFKSTQLLTDRPLKATLTGPATLADWALLKSKKYYQNRRIFRMDLARALRREIKHLIEAGAKIIQVDEPALTTKMQNFATDIDAISESIRGFENQVYLILHICYSDQDALDKAFPEILTLPFRQIHMEMANRNYELMKLIEKHGFGDKDVGLGVIDVHSDRIETEEEITAGVKLALRYFHPNQIWLTPDCGLKERSDEIAKKKLQTMTSAAKVCRERFS